MRSVLHVGTNVYFKSWSEYPARKKAPSPSYSSAPTWTDVDGVRAAPRGQPGGEVDSWVIRVGFPRSKTYSTALYTEAAALKIASEVARRGDFVAALYFRSLGRAGLPYTQEHLDALPEIGYLAWLADLPADHKAHDDAPAVLQIHFFVSKHSCGFGSVRVSSRKKHWQRQLQIKLLPAKKNFRWTAGGAFPTRPSVN